MIGRMRQAASDPQTRVWVGLGAAAVIASLMTVVLVAFVINPAPPRRLSMATGPEGGLYAAAGEALSARLAAHGVRLDLVTTNGSVENLSRLMAGEDEAVDVAILQGGVGSGEGRMASMDAEADAPAAVESLGAVFLEPLWLFHREALALRDLRDVRGLSLAVGPEGSGTRALVLTLLAENGIDGADVRLSPLSGAAAAEALAGGDIDAASFVTGPDRPYVRRLLAAPGVAALDFSRADAYARRHGYLSALRLPRGVLNLETDTPAADLHLTASAASLVVREDLHPALQALLLQAAHEVFADGGVLAPAGAFPDPSLTAFELTSQARRYYERGGPSFLRRYLPFWAANMIERLWVLAIPAATLLYPLGKAAPPVYRWRIRSRIIRWYKDLRRLEDEGARAENAQARAAVRAELRRILKEAATTDVPLMYTDDVYRLRSHIHFVHELLEDVDEGQPSAVGARLAQVSD